jgi:hypothetical protein
VKDLAIALDNRPGALADMGEALGRDGVSIEGGGVFEGIAHILFEDATAARKTLESAGIRVVRESEVVIVRLRQSEPGQLGKIARRMADAGVNIEVQYSDHDHPLILVVDDIKRAKVVADEWMRSR